MTILTDREVSRFRDLYDKEEWAEIAEYGEELLKKDPRDGMAIRFGVLDAYTVLGNSKGAEELLIRYCDYAEDEDDDPFHYRSAQEIWDSWNEEQRDTWQSSLRPGYRYSLAMAYWKDGREDEARQLIDSMPQYLDDYLGLDEEGLQQKRTEHRFRFKPGTAEELHMTIGVPYDDQIGFRNWIKGWRK